MPRSAPKGNKNGMKLKEAEIRQLAYDKYCEHIGEGKPKQSFWFEHQGFNCTWETLDKYIADNPLEFPSHKMQAAKAKRMAVWMGKGNNLLEGKYKGGSPVVWQTIMRNMFRDQGWDQAILAGHEKSSVDKMVDQLDGGSH